MLTVKLSKIFPQGEIGLLRAMQKVLKSVNIDQPDYVKIHSNVTSFIWTATKLWV